MIASQQKLPAPPVPYGEGKHSAQMLHTVTTMLFVEMKDDLDVGSGFECVPARNQLSSQ
jgi:hypothetical protein